MTKQTLIAGLAAALLLGTSAQAGPPTVLPQSINGGAPSGIALCDEGYLLTDTFHKILWQVDGDGAVRHAAGQIAVEGLDGVPRGRYEDGTLDTAFFMEPWDIAPFEEGWAVTDAGANVVRFVNDEGVHTLAGSGKEGSRDDSGKRASFRRPTGLAADDSGNLYVSDTGNGSIRKITPDRKVTTLCDGLDEPTGLYWQEDCLYIAETGAHRVQTWGGDRLTVLAGGEQGNATGPAAQARFHAPQDVALGLEGTIYIADSGNGCVRKLADGIVTTVRQAENGMVLPRSLAVWEDRLLVTDPFLSTVWELDLTPPRFEDVSPDAWYHDTVLEAVDRGLVSGVSATRFNPDGPLTRGMFLHMLANLQRGLDGDLVLDGSRQFTDVPPDSRFAPSIRWAADLGITDGTGPQTFSPNAPLTRQQLVTFLYRYARLTGRAALPTTDLSGYADAHQIAPYAREALSWAVELGILQGDGTALRPTAPATRVHGTAVLLRFQNCLDAA